MTLSRNMVELRKPINSLKLRNRDHLLPLHLIMVVVAVVDTVHLPHQLVEPHLPPLEMLHLHHLHMDMDIILPRPFQIALPHLLHHQDMVVAVDMFHLLLPRLQSMSQPHPHHLQLALKVHHPQCHLLSQANHLLTSLW